MTKDTWKLVSIIDIFWTIHVHTKQCKSTSPCFLFQYHWIELGCSLPWRTSVTSCGVSQSGAPDSYMWHTYTITINTCRKDVIWTLVHSIFEAWNVAKTRSDTKQITKLERKTQALLDHWKFLYSKHISFMKYLSFFELIPQFSWWVNCHFLHLHEHHITKRTHQPSVGVNERCITHG